ncbi:TRAP transporter small permease [Roseovarius rhodophyticola]|uniref:TRAP transporter small permease protein n=1 Tax=Roseovarius rhodophyticola TaxID=3080827 RepID=A0ABZ2TKC3_9RHOB|nr:TRAP transporter small permease [Roseovarius sp. W115]
MIELADQLPPRVGATVKQLLKIKSFFLIISTFILALTFFLVVVFRYILESDLFAYEEWLLPMCFWLFFLGSAVGTYDDTQIKADILEEWFKNPRAIWMRRVILTAIELIITIFLVYWAVLMLRDELASYPQWQTTIALRIPFFVPRLGIFVGLVFMALYSALHLYVLLKLGVDAFAKQLEADAEAKRVEREAEQ